MLGKRFLIPLLAGIGTVGIALAIAGKWNLLLWGIFLLCPLMHLFGHNHSGHLGSSKHHH
ncbi:MAG: DUF2933 domain-containing protein [Ectobacillus sp.]